MRLMIGLTMKAGQTIHPGLIHAGLVLCSPGNFNGLGHRQFRDIFGKTFRKNL
jgi:hypothetical protein